jgi:hypothetical protein
VGYKVLYDHIFFRTSGTYKLRIEDDYGRFDEVTVYVGNSGCGSSCPSANTANNLLLETSDTTPDLNQYVSTYITARDGSSRAYNYYGTVNFVVEKKDGLYWYNASSSDYALSPSSSYFASNDQ